jgi:Leucine-rich repeat (LRR) protein
MKLQGLNNLEDLSLDHNQISRIEDGTFNNLDRLYELGLIA